MIFDMQDMLCGRRVILASKSPRRQELLKLIFDSFEIEPAVGEELIPKGTPSDKASELLARQKCDEIAKKYPDALVIGCDTTVVLGDTILGKPVDDEDAARMLRMLSDSTHKVISGAAVCIDGRTESFSEVTQVRFRKLSDEEIGAYVATGEPSDKAGAYGIQEKGSLLTEGICGDFFNVVGLPVPSLARLICKMLGGDTDALR